MPPLDVSVVIVNWNTRAMVLRLLASLSTPSTESPHELELIVVDNDSSDGSVEAIRREFPVVKLVAQSENRGFAGGVNPGVSVATKPLVLLPDTDAETSRGSIEEAARYMTQHPEVGILGQQIVSPQHDPQSSAWRDPSLKWLALSALGLSRIRSLNFERYHGKPFTQATEVECVSGCAMVSELRGFDEDYFVYFEETDFCVRAQRRGKQLHHAPIGEFVHDEGGTSRTVRLRSFLDFRRSEILFHRKHGGVAAAIAARGLLTLSSGLRVPPLAVLSLVAGSERARAQLRLHWSGLSWLLNPWGWPGCQT